MKRIAIEFDADVVDARALARAVAYVFESSRVRDGSTYIEGFSMNPSDKWKPAIPESPSPRGRSHCWGFLVMPALELAPTGGGMTLVPHRARDGDACGFSRLLKRASLALQAVKRTVKFIDLVLSGVVAMVNSSTPT